MKSDRLDALILARVAGSPRGTTAAEVAKATARFAPGTLDARAWADRVAEAWRALVAAGAMDDPRAPWPATPWNRIVDRVVPGLGLGVRPDDTRAHGRLADRDAWAAAIVARAEGLWRDGAPPTLNALCDQLVWRGLGLAGAPKRTPREIRALFAAKLLGEPGAAAPEKHIRLEAARVLGAARADLRALRDALGRRWLAGDELGVRDDLGVLADAVRDAADHATEGVFGDRKVFIASVWKHLAGQPPALGLDLDAFKRRLVEAHRAGLVSLVRADLVSAMDPELVASSETRSGDARFHFVVRGQPA